MKLDFTEEELLILCKKKNIGKRKTEWAIEFFIDKIDNKTLAEKYKVEVDSIKQRKKRLKKELMY